ncbi:EAL domain-containing protein [Silvimonas sp. JCM 19000]
MTGSAPASFTFAVIDDSTLQRRAAVELCRMLGGQLVGEADDGNAGLAMLQALAVPPQVLIIDLEMPNMDGIAMIQQLAHLGLPTHLVIASSRESSLLSTVETMVQAVGMQLLGALRKPLTVTALEHALGKFQPIAPVRRQARPDITVSVQELTDAIQNGELTNFYQPKVTLHSGVIKGVETLVRWQHPDKGMIMPMQFIALAEKHGLIDAMTLRVLDMALASCKRWHDGGLKISVAVNLSARSLANSHLADDIVQRVQASGVDPHLLVMEITESAVMDDLGASLATLARLRLKGIGLSIDDYGTGFSSMQQLSRVPFTELKIDRSFVDGIAEKPQLRVFLESAVAMARKLQITSVAEGVETLEDWRLLQALGCDLAQGYFVARPMPGGELVSWLKQNNARLKAACQQP